MADLAKIILPSGDEYNFKDAQAREHIQDHNNPHQVTAEQAGAVPESELDGEISTVTGDIVTFETESAQILPSVVVDIDPVQDLHGYDHPWPAGGGDNLFNNALFTDRTIGGITSVAQEDGTILLTGTATSTARYAQPNNFLTLPAGTYRITGTPLEARARDVSTAIDSDGIFVLSETKTIGISVNVPLNTSISVYEKIMLTSGSEIKSFAPYSNICPISGWDGCTVERTGKNLFNEDSANFKNGFFLDASGVENSNSGYQYTQNYIKVLPSTAYCIQAYNAGATVACTVCFYDSNKQFLERVIAYAATAGTGIKSGTFTTTESTKYIRFSIIKNATEIMLESGEIVSEYEPYSGTIYSISFPSSAGTVYGGTLDVTNGLLTVTHDARQVPAIKSYITSISLSEETVSFWIYVPGLVIDASGGTPICDTLKYHPEASVSTLSLNEFCWSTSYPNSFFCRMSTTLVGTTLDSIWEYLHANPLTVYTQLSLPVTYQLTPTQVTALLGQNNILADTGDSTVIYRTGKLALLSDVADSVERVREYLNNKIGSLTATDVGAAKDSSIASVEPTSTASANYAVGDHLMLGGVLYEVTVPIASGETITQGTNVTPVTVMESMAELAGAIPQHYNASTNPTGYLTISDLPLYDGTVI